MTNQIKFNPTRDWVVVPFQDKNKTDSGILLAGGAENSLRKNVVKIVAAGPDCKEVKVGDTVMIHPESHGLIIDLEEGKFVMVNEFSICGVLQ